jgi:2-amino-4-hydroxy-6-hydroxymethyldihydropteridine diphosphokinase
MDRTFVAAPHQYVIALGSNRALSHALKPQAILRAALARLDDAPFRLISASPIITSRPVGPSRRSYANGAALVECALAPLAMLVALQALEKGFGRKRARRWAERTLDLDIIFWSGGRFASGRLLTIPHRAWAKRDFVVTPLATIVRSLRVPPGAVSVGAHAARLERPKPVDRFLRRL